MGRATSSGTRWGDDGALVAEFGLVLPFLALIVLGIFEFGMGWRESANLASALRGTARQVTNLGDARSADYFALQSYQATMAQARRVETNRVVIYLATGSSGQPSDGSCLTTAPPVTGTAGYGVTNHCNIYTRAQITNLGASYLTNFGTTDTSCALTAWDRFWCPLNRNADQGDPPDWVGVYANVTYDSYTGLIPNTITITDRVVMRNEPRVG
jgi:Flp pilus assembly protein TadG